MRSRLLRFIALAVAAACAGCANADAGSEVLTERAKPATAFIDSIGVNVHLTYTTSAYGNVPAVQSLLKRLGISHVRDGVTLAQPQVCTVDRALAAQGIRFDYITQPGLTRAQLASWASCVGPALASFEGPNEYDISHPQSDPDWVSTIRTAQIALYRNVKGDPALAALPVIGPSLTSENAFRTVGDLSSSMDFGNMHNYLAGHEPGTSGWGLDGYGSIAWNMRVARATDGDKPIWSTENGYSTGGGDPKAVNADVQGVYVPVLFLEQFAAGVPRTYDYQLIDEGGAPFSRYGIVDASLQPKPAFRAVASLVGVLRDTGTGVANAQPQRFIFEGSDGATHHLLLAKRDGSFALVVWENESLFDPALGRTLDATVRSVQLHLLDGYREATVYGVDDGDTLRAGATTRNGAPVSLAVGPHPLVVRWTPRTP